MVSASEIVIESLREFSELQTYRAVHAETWEETAELVLPTSRNTFYYGNYNFPGQKKTDKQVDSNAALALERFGAIVDSLMTPRNMMWHGLAADNDYLMKSRRVRLWFELATKALFKGRYSPRANFSGQNCLQWQSMGAFGTGSLFIDKYEGVDMARGLRYKNLPLGEMFLRENHQGLVDGFCRWFRLTPGQACKKFVDKVPDQIKSLAAQNSQAPLDFLHRVCPRDDYDPERWDEKGKLYASYYISLTFQSLISEGGYRTFPMAPSRYMQTPGEIYGRGPITLALPSIKTINAEKRDYLTAGHRRVTPPLLLADDGVADLSLRPGALIAGGLDSSGNELVKPLMLGDPQFSEEMMERELAVINGACLVDLFKILLDDPKVYAATQVVEMMAQRGILIAPTLGRQQSEYLGPMIERELDVAIEERLIPPPPPELVEAGGEYQVVYTSPFSRDMRAQEVAGFTRTLEMTLNVVNATGDPSPLDRFDFDTLIPAIAQIQAMPESWMASDDQVEQKRQARAAAAQQTAETNQLPAKAAMVKAQAVAAKAGFKPGGFGQPIGPSSGAPLSLPLK